MAKPLRRYLFHVRRTNEGPIEPLEVVAYDSFEAVNALPDDVVFWDFAQHADGRYSLPVDEQAAA